jgi:hypothetical protein
LKIEVVPTHDEINNYTPPYIAQSPDKRSMEILLKVLGWMQELLRAGIVVSIVIFLVFIIVKIYRVSVAVLKRYRKTTTIRRGKLG